MLFALCVLCPLAAAGLVRRHSAEVTAAVGVAAELGKPFTHNDHVMVLDTFMNGKVEITKGTFGVVLTCCARNGAAKILFDSAAKDQMVRPKNFKHLQKSGSIDTPTDEDFEELDGMMDGSWLEETAAVGVAAAVGKPFTHNDHVMVLETFKI